MKMRMVVVHVIDFSLKPVFDDRGSVSMLIPEGRDVTDLEEARRAETQMYNGLTEPDGKGLHLLSPPRHVTRMWTGTPDGFELDSPGGAIGVPLGRYSDAAATGMLDGHAAAIAPVDLNDMRRWSNKADRAEYEIP